MIKIFVKRIPPQNFVFQRILNNGKTTQEADDNLALINSELPIISSARIIDLASQLGFTKIIKFFKALHVEGLVMNR
jgi:hypothetical protein